MNKQETLEEASLNHFLSTSNVIVKDIKDYDFKQETLEEAAKKEYNDNLFDYEKYRDGFVIGAKWQAKRMYSEKEVYNLLEQAMKDAYDYQLEGHYNGDYKDLKKWFEQVKKK